LEFHGVGACQKVLGGEHSLGGIDNSLVSLSATGFVVRRPTVIIIIIVNFIKNVADIVFCFWLSAIECLPVAFSRVVNSTDVTPGTVVNVTCPPGQFLANGKYNITSTCGTDGAWNPNIPDCKGLCVFLISLFFLFFVVIIIRQDSLVRVFGSTANIS